MPQLDVFVGPTKSLASKFVFSVRNVLLDAYSDVAVAVDGDTPYLMPALSFDYALGMTHGTGMTETPQIGDVVHVGSGKGIARYFRITAIRKVKHLVNGTSGPLSLSQYFNVELPPSSTDNESFRSLLRATLLSYLNLLRTDPYALPGVTTFFDYLQAGHSDTILRTWTAMTVAESLAETAQLNLADRQSWITAFELGNSRDSTVWSRASAALQEASLGTAVRNLILQAINFQTLVFKVQALPSITNSLSNLTHIVRTQFHTAAQLYGNYSDTAYDFGYLRSSSMGGSTAELLMNQPMAELFLNRQPQPGSDPALHDALTWNALYPDLPINPLTGQPYVAYMPEADVATVSDAGVEIAAPTAVDENTGEPISYYNTETGEFVSESGGEESLSENESVIQATGPGPIVQHIQSLNLDPSAITTILATSDSYYRNALYKYTQPQKVMVVRLDNTVRKVRRITLVGYQIRGWTEYRGITLARQAVVHLRGVDGSVVSSDPVLHRAFAVLPLGADASSRFDYENGVASATVNTSLRALEVTVADRSGNPLHVDGLWFRIDAEC